MKQKCVACGKEMPPENQPQGDVAADLCAACRLQLSAPSERPDLLDAFNAPILLMQGNPRQVITANRKALELFNKGLHEVESHRGGEVFNCVHSFTEAGCGKDVNCENCAIKNAIVDTFTTGQPHNNISAPLQIVKPEGTKTYRLEISTQKLGEQALVRVDRFEKSE